MKSLTESPAVLTVHEGPGGQYILRVSDLKHRPLVIQLTKLLSDASSFVIITPTDIKVFNAEADREQEQVPEEEESSDIPQPETVPAEEVEPPKTRKRGRPPQVAGHDETCGRCRGEGQIQTLMDGGVPATTSCPVCKGEGVTIRYGARR